MVKSIYSFVYFNKHVSVLVVDIIQIELLDYDINNFWICIHIYLKFSMGVLGVGCIFRSNSVYSSTFL